MANRSDTPGAAPSGMRLLRAVLAGLLAAALVLAGANALLPAQTAHDPARLYDYVYSGMKSESTAFTLATMSDDGYLAFGSSEFYISKDKVAQCPQRVLGENVTGVDLTYVGEAYDQSLWQAIAAGAYGSQAKNRKAMIVVSPQWFFKGNGDQGKFASKFSYALYRQFADNPSISDETKAYVRSRVEQLGVDAKTTAATHRDTPLDAVNDAVRAAADDLRLRSELPSVVGQAPLKSAVRAAGQPTGEPDWDALLEEADASGDAACTTNDYGVYDAYWQKNSGYDAERGQTFSQADEEYADLACFLQVCHETGIEPLVVILPVHGAWYDREGVSADERQAYYERVRGIADAAGAAYADFSTCEYEKYFLCDTVHPGWRGWVRIEQAFYDFVHDRDDSFLGGGSFGAAEGLDAAGNAGASLAGAGEAAS
ncbi:MAG TPA: D-alanyl-lipoteichoic acid biosynthesis protein DltD [Gordonibacter urolithinfaciens]|uniref:D-alanyl-lipoteichoic acid biosynthesis protein DltD n=1 Tax=Gordonibacter urolithinfaciens TaxID=1335613 RepID=UPI001DBD63D8|nr:D-alanyl-lipoteichoic acid biosynthesis protein DltD [Gordonibacter urolithinfaciens]HJF63144.1 D-alanyl-lipoteichoic acid biosynthesis protein DltD [Gordonibacter urolithinfaciens]